MSALTHPVSRAACSPWVLEMWPVAQGTEFLNLETPHCYQWNSVAKGKSSQQMVLGQLDHNVKQKTILTPALYHKLKLNWDGS